MVMFLIPSTDVIQLTLTLKMTTAQVVETSVTVNNNGPIQDYVHPDDQTQPFEILLFCIRPGGVASSTETQGRSAGSELNTFSREIVCVAVYARARQTCQARAGENSSPFQVCKFVVKYFSSNSDARGSH